MSSFPHRFSHDGVLIMGPFKISPIKHLGLRKRHSEEAKNPSGCVSPGSLPFYEFVGNNLLGLICSSFPSSILLPREGARIRRR